MKEVMGSLVRLPKPLETFYAAVMQRKHDDHHASHNNRANQALHLLSSSVFVFCYCEDLLRPHDRDVLGAGGSRRAAVRPCGDRARLP